MASVSHQGISPARDGFGALVAGRPRARATTPTTDFSEECGEVFFKSLDGLLVLRVVVKINLPAHVSKSHRARSLRRQRTNLPRRGRFPRLGEIQHSDALGKHPRSRISRLISAFPVFRPSNCSTSPTTASMCFNLRSMNTPAPTLTRPCIFLPTAIPSMKSRSKIWWRRSASSTLLRARKTTLTRALRPKTSRPGSPPMATYRIMPAWP